MSIRELALRRIVPVWINSCNQVTYLKNIVGKFIANDFHAIFVLDNGSDYEPLQDYYQEVCRPQSPVTVFFYNINRGPRYFHYKRIYSMIGDGPHLFTDPDIDFDTLADDFLCRLIDLSETLKIPKVGVALEIPDEREIKQAAAEGLSVRQNEQKYWTNPIAENIFDAPVDTTLHLFNPKYFTNPDEFIQGIRVAGPGFTVRHLPWYKTDPMPPDEYLYYKSRDIGYSHC